MSFDVFVFFFHCVFSAVTLETLAVLVKLQHMTKTPLTEVISRHFF